MQLSGLVVTAKLGRFDEALSSLAATTGVSANERDAAPSRVVAVREAPTIGSEMETFAAIRLMAPVASAGHCARTSGATATIDGGHYDGCCATRRSRPPNRWSAKQAYRAGIGSDAILDAVDSQRVICR
jgi:hypothetical protein